MEETTLVGFELKSDGTIKLSSTMTLRQWYAGRAPDKPSWFGKAAMEQAIGAGVDIDDWIEEIFFKWRWHYADAMIKEGEK